MKTESRVSEEQGANLFHMLCHAVSFLPTLQDKSSASIAQAWKTLCELRMSSDV